MDKKFVIITIVVAVLAAVASGLIVSNTHKDFKFAVIDEAKVLNASSQLNALRAESALKVQELQALVQTAKKEAAAEKTEAKKREIIEKYEREIGAKKAVIENEQAQKTQQIVNDIKETIKNVADKNDVSVVVVNASVVTGGEDITEDVIKELK